MEKNFIELKVSHKALVGSYLYNVVWTVIALVALVAINAGGKHIIGQYMSDDEAHYYERFESGKQLTDFGLKEHSKLRKVDSYVEFWKISSRKDLDDVVLLFFLAIGAVICVLVGFLNARDILGGAYASRTVTKISKSEGKIAERSYGFPFKQEDHERRFDRIVAVTTRQGNFDSALNTGSIRLELLTYANADTVRSVWLIENVENPKALAEAILEGLPQYEGLKVVLER
jgi:hypothetical protein